MNEIDKSFLPDTGLEHAIDLLRQIPIIKGNLPDSFPNNGIGELQTLDLLAPYALGHAARLDKSDALAHMDPPTPWITWATALWNARLNQNLLHPATAPFALEAEKKVMDWLTPFFGMNGGHMCSGSTIANLTALWAARDAKVIKKIIASRAAHVSVEKSAQILGLAYEQVATNPVLILTLNAQHLSEYLTSDIRISCLQASPPGVRRVAPPGGSISARLEYRCAQNNTSYSESFFSA